MRMNRAISSTLLASVAFIASEFVMGRGVNAQTMINAPRWGGLCLDIANPEGKGPQNGSPVLAFQCHGGGNQIFQMSSDGTIRAPRWGGLCLDIANPEGKGPQNGSPVLAFQCHGGGNQRWSIGSSGNSSPSSSGTAPAETSSEVVGERYEDMGGGWGGAKATLYRNGVLVIEGRAVSNANNSGTRTTVNVVGVDRRGNALFVSTHLDIPTACGRWDPTCPSDRRGNSTQQINSEVAKYVNRLNIHISDRNGPTVYQNFVRNIREACSSYQELPSSVRMGVAAQSGFSGCN